MSDAYPLLRLQPGKDRRLRDGYPWAFANELVIDQAARAIPPGAPVRLADARGHAFAVAGFNVHSLIAARVLARDPQQPIDRAFLAARIAEAQGWRERLVGGSHYRLIHAEADGLPGLVVDRYGDVLVVQANTATADRLLPDVVGALQERLQPRAIVGRNDSGVRHQEGLPTEVTLLAGEAPGRVAIEENGLTYLADPMGGQKTGWFFDLREARALVARHARPGMRMLDLYCHTGAFALLAARAGAQVLAVDRSKPALELAEAAAAAAGLATACRFERRDAAEALERLDKAGERFDIVVADPPAFAKSRKDLAPALAAHRRLAEAAARRVAAGGLLFIACCAHHVPAAEFLAASATGIASARRDSRLIFSGTAGPDHPVHPLLPESAYLKWHLFALA
ncbi:class I SAM-dependent rRNA methyltransferase [Desertibaculum subflavum]|uniref:class I SAM-dependent rRNA methyltransferase n=1 Tax=Desertibaculum subflavum TaxID=2268458 RepID=UPI000E65FAA6